MPAGAVGCGRERIRLALFASPLMAGLGQQLSMFVFPHFLPTLFDHTAQTITSPPATP
jgi:hypothetical protein